MRSFTSTLLPAGAFLLSSLLPSASGCTFSIQTSQNKVNFGGSNTVSCDFYAYTSDSPDLYSDNPDAYAELECPGGCATLTLDDKDWEACIDETSDIDLSGTATVKQVGDDASTQTIYPGGQESSRVDDNPLASGRYHFFWLSDVSC
ncbi:hypothetical protein BDV06DRAFT_115844 [Aspergillus oleicola]